MIITSKDNPGIKKYIKLSQSRGERNADGLFVLEGMRLIRDAITENAPIECIYATEKAFETLGIAVSPDTKILFVSDEIAAKMSSTEATQGIFSVCRTLDKINLSDTIYNSGRYVLLNSIQDPGNLGMILRTADAMGIDGVFLSDCCDVYNPKVVRSTMGSLFRVPYARIASCDAMAAFAAHGVKTYAAVIDGECDASDTVFAAGCALLIGNEGNGLPRELSAACDFRVTIKMHGNIDSLNAAMAAGILMFLMSVGGKEAEHG